MDYKQFLGWKIGWVPALRWFPMYSTRRLALDLMAGLSLAAFVIPESLAYASLAQLPSRLVRLQELRRLRIESGAEFWTAMVACLGVLSFGLLDGLLLAAVGSLVMLIAHTSRPVVVALGRDRSTGYFVSRARNPDASDTPGALVVRSTSTWLYYNAEHIRRQILDMVDTAPAQIRTVVLDFSSVAAIDITAGVILRGLVRALQGSGPSTPKSLQSQNRPRPENRLSISRLDVVHGQQFSLPSARRRISDRLSTKAKVEDGKSVTSSAQPTPPS